MESTESRNTCPITPEPPISQELLEPLTSFEREAFATARAKVARRTLEGILNIADAGMVLPEDMPQS